MANSRKMTAAERRRYQRIRSRAMAKKAQETDDKPIEDIEDIDTDEVDAKCRARAARKAYANYLRRKKAQEVVEKGEDKEDEKPAAEPPADIEPDPEEKKDVEARRRAARRAALRRARRRAAMRRRAQETEDEPADEPIEEEVEDEAVEARRRASRRAALRRARRRAAMRRKAQEVSDDLKDVDGDSSNIEQLHNGKSVSDDLATTDEEKGGVQVEPPASVDEAESKVLSAYALIDAQIAQKVIPANSRKAALASSYCKKYTSKEMKFAAEQLGKVGAAGKKAGNVRVSRRSAMPKTAAVAKKTGFEDQCLFA